MISKRKFLFAASSATAVAAASALIAGVTLGLFSSQAPSGNSTFSSGTVSVTKDATSYPCAVTSLVPGETSATNSGQDKPCTFVIDNSSSVPIYAAVDVFIATGKAVSVGGAYGSTATVTPSDLYDGSNNTGLNITITDGPHTFTTPVAADAETCPTSSQPFYAALQALTSPAADTCYMVPDLLLSTAVVPPTTTTISTLTANWSLPVTAGNAYEGGDVVFAFMAHGVQSANNALPSTCTAVGQTCAASGSFLWS